MHEHWLACLGNPGLNVNLVSALEAIGEPLKTLAKTDRSH